MNRKSILALICLSLPSCQLLASTTTVYERDLINADQFNGNTEELPSEMIGSDNSVLFSQLFQSANFIEHLNLEQIPVDTFVDIKIKGIVNTSAARQLTLQLLASSLEGKDINVPMTCGDSINECIGSLKMTPEIAELAAEYDKINIVSDADIALNPVDAKTVRIEYETEDLNIEVHNSSELTTVHFSKGDEAGYLLPETGASWHIEPNNDDTLTLLNGDSSYKLEMTASDTQLTYTSS